eukprot:1022108-Amphidinium_carterae.1
MFCVSNKPAMVLAVKAALAGCTLAVLVLVRSRPQHYDLMRHAELSAAMNSSVRSMMVLAIFMCPLTMGYACEPRNPTEPPKPQIINNGSKMGFCTH